MNKIFASFHFIYIVMAVVIAILSFGDISTSASISGVIAPIIAWFGGSGLRGSFNVGDKKQKMAGLLAGIVFLVISLFWINYTNYFIKVSNTEVSGPVWSFLGFLVGFAFSTKKHSENNFE